MGLRGYLDNQLGNNEYIIYRAHLSWIPVILHVIPFFLLGSLIGGVVWTFLGFFFGILATLLCVIIGILCQMKRIFTNLGTDILVTNQKIRSKTGLITIKDDRAASLSRLDDSDIDFVTIWNRLFRYGNIEIRTIGDRANEGFFTFKDISRPRILKSALDRARNQFSAWNTDNQMQNMGYQNQGGWNNPNPNMNQNPNFQNNGFPPEYNSNNNYRNNPRRRQGRR